jgi:hypothetical protein
MKAARAGFKRLREVWFTLVQTSVAAGLAWYLAHDVLDHPQPFFAPIAAAVSLSISNVLRAQRAIQMMIGVTLGIGLGTLVQLALGPGAISLAVAALIALCAAVLIGHGYIGHGMMFANQTVISAILVLALFRSGVGWERIFDALIGGCLAIVFAVVLFPADPLKLLRRARVGVLGVLQGVLTRTADIAAGRRAPRPTGRCRPSTACTNNWAGSSRPAPPPVRSCGSRHDDGGCATRCAPRITRRYTSPCSPGPCWSWPAPPRPSSTVAATSSQSPCPPC